MWLVLVGFAVAAVVWVGTVIGLWQDGQPLLAAAALFIPPLDLVLAFLVNAWLGFAAIAAVLAFWVGGLLRNIEETM